MQLISREPWQPGVSVVMAVHNGQKYVVEAIESICSQSFDNFEFLIVDDASSDDTPSILAAQAARDHRIRILRNERNLGPYPSANRALEEARAGIIARIDADDISVSERLARQVRFLELHPKCLLVGSGYRSIDVDGRTRFVKNNPMTPDVARWTARLCMPMVHPSFCFRSRLPDGKPVRYSDSYPVAADYALAAMLSRVGDIASLGDPLVSYRMHPANISSTRLDLQRSAARRISAEAINGHYPPHLVRILDPLLDCIHRRGQVDAALLALAVKGMDSILAFDGGTDPPAWMKQRAAGILAEACLGGIGELRATWLALNLAVRGPRHLVPLAIRAAQIRNFLTQRPDPERR